MCTRIRLAMTEDLLPELDQTCDRCGPAVRAVYHARRPGELYLCGHCANRMRPALAAQAGPSGFSTSA
jgi:ribosomal protein S27AE